MGFPRQAYWSGLPLPSPSGYLGAYKCKNSSSCMLKIYSFMDLSLITSKPFIFKRILFFLSYLFIWLHQVLTEAHGNPLSSLQHSRSLVAALFLVACGISFPDQELNLRPLYCKHGVFATGPLEKSHQQAFF